MEDLLRNKIAELKLFYVDTPVESIQKIYELFCQDVVGEPITGLELFYFGSYYQFVGLKMELAERYYYQGIKQGDINALFNLITYLCKINNLSHAKDILDESMKYYDETSYQLIGDLYFRVNDYEQMKQYYLLAIALGNTIAMNDIGFYYQYTEHNLTLAKIYYQQAINHGYGVSAYNLSVYYRKKRKYESELSYLKKAVKLEDETAIVNLSKHYMKKLPKEKYLLFGLTHQSAKLIVHHYQPEHVHYLLRGLKKDLSLTLIKARQEYLTNLFAYYQQEGTWFKHYCVKDISASVRLYLNLLYNKLK